jgi:hypothetical protein
MLDFDLNTARCLFNQDGRRSFDGGEGPRAESGVGLRYGTTKQTMNECTQKHLR